MPRRNRAFAVSHSLHRPKPQYREVWLIGVIFLPVVLYLVKCAVGIDLVKGCHADEVLIGCTTPSVSTEVEPSLLHYDPQSTSLR
ncbi:MAG: hypothetical protein ACKO1W_00595 [Microcystaceae cyanobacterium]